MAARRKVLAGLSALGLAAKPAVAVAIDDPHLEWERQCSDLVAEMDALPHSDAPGYQTLWARWRHLQEQICITPAHTSAGVAVQVHLAVVTTDEGSTLAYYEVAGLRNAVRSLQQLAGRA